MCPITDLTGMHADREKVCVLMNRVPPRVNVYVYRVWQAWV